MGKLMRKLTVALALILIVSVFPLSAYAYTDSQGDYYLAMDVNTYGPIGLPQKPISYKSENPSIAGVDSNGIVTAYKRGFTYITARYKNKTIRIDVYVTEKFMSYTDTQTFKIEVPSSWKMDDSYLNRTAFLSPSVGVNDSYSEFLWVSKESLPDNSTMKINDSFAKDWIDGYKTTLKDFKVLSNIKSSVLTESGKKIPARIFVYTYTHQAGFKLQVYECVYIYDHKAVLFSFKAEEANYYLFYPEVQRALQSFRALS